MTAGSGQRRTEELLPSLRTIPVFVAAKNDTGASQPATTVREGYDEQQLAAVVNIAEEDRDDNTPIFLRDTPPNIPRNAENLVPQSLNPVYKHPDARPAARISNALIAKQGKGEEGRTTTPWH